LDVALSGELELGLVVDLAQFVAGIDHTPEDDIYGLHLEHVLETHILQNTLTPDLILLLSVWNESVGMNHLWLPHTLHQLVLHLLSRSHHDINILHNVLDIKHCF
jgi:hypothetical protein